jgi:hypothetical protein
MDIATVLDMTLRAQGIPIVGVSIGSPSVRSTWTIQYDPAATTQQRADGETTRLAFDPVAPSVVAAVLDAEALASVDVKMIKAAVVCSLWGRLGRQPTAPEIAAERTRFINIYKAL